MLNVKNAEIADLEQIMKIYRYAQDYMIKSGNPTQWGHFYPDADLIKSDIDKNACKVIYDKNGIHGVFALFDGTEPTYKHIEGGNWLNEEPYLTIHRLAGDGQVHGLFPCALNYCKKISLISSNSNRSIRHLLLVSILNIIVSALINVNIFSTLIIFL